jgi:hypothetical protein
MKRKVAIVIVSLYAFTWIGGWITHSRNVARRADFAYGFVKQHTIEQLEEARARGASEEELFIIRYHGHFEEGPSSSVLCVPLLPGILLAGSGRSLGPLSGGGTCEIVFFYGLGSMDLCRVCDLYGV